MRTSTLYQRLTGFCRRAPTPKHSRCRFPVFLTQTPAISACKTRQLQPRFHLSAEALLQRHKPGAHRRRPLPCGCEEGIRSPPGSLPTTAPGAGARLTPGSTVPGPGPRAGPEPPSLTIPARCRLGSSGAGHGSAP